MKAWYFALLALASCGSRTPLEIDTANADAGLPMPDSGASMPDSGQAPEPKSAPWPMLQGNAGHSGRAIVSGASQAKLAWSIETPCVSSPVIDADGIIYVSTTADGVLALRDDGSTKWTLASTGVWGGGIGLDEKTATLYLASGGTMRAIRTADGTIAWSTKFHDYAQGYPMIASDGSIYVGATAFNGGAFGFRPDGTLAWSYIKKDWRFGATIALAPDGTIYMGAIVGDNIRNVQDALVALDRNGQARWLVTLPPHGPMDWPVVDDDGVIYLQMDRGVIAMNPDGTQRWSFVTKDNGGTGTIAVARDGTVYSGVNDELLGLGRDGAVVSRMPGRGAIPTIDANGAIYFLVALTPDGPGALQLSNQGASVWNYPVAHPQSPIPAAIGVGHRTYVCDGKHLLAFGP